MDVNTMMLWSKSMTWKGLHPIGTLNKAIYEKGITLTDLEMKEINNLLQRNPLLPSWDILICPI